MLQIHDLGNTSAFSSVGLLADTLVVAGETNVSIQIIGFNKVCLGQGSVRDTFQSASIVMVYRNASNGVEFTVQVEYRCSGGVWDVLYGINDTPSITFNPTATLNTNKRQDCILCISPRVSPLALAATLSSMEHCAGEFISAPPPS